MNCLTCNEDKSLKILPCGNLICEYCTVRYCTDYKTGNEYSCPKCKILHLDQPNDFQDFLPEQKLKSNFKTKEELLLEDDLKLISKRVDEIRKIINDPENELMSYCYEQKNIIQLSKETKIDKLETTSEEFNYLINDYQQKRISQLHGIMIERNFFDHIDLFCDNSLKILDTKETEEIINEKRIETQSILLRLKNKKNQIRKQIFGEQIIRFKDDEQEQKLLGEIESNSFDTVFFNRSNKIDLSRCLITRDVDYLDIKFLKDDKILIVYSIEHHFFLKLVNTKADIIEVIDEIPNVYYFEILSNKNYFYINFYMEEDLKIIKIYDHDLVIKKETNYENENCMIALQDDHIIFIDLDINSETPIFMIRDWNLDLKDSFGQNLFPNEPFYFKQQFFENGDLHIRDNKIIWLGDFIEGQTDLKITDATNGFILNSTTVKNGTKFLIDDLIDTFQIIVICRDVNEFLVSLNYYNSNGEFLKIINIVDIPKTINLYRDMFFQENYFYIFEKQNFSLFRIKRS